MFQEFIANKKEDIEKETTIYVPLLESDIETRSSNLSNSNIGLIDDNASTLNLENNNDSKTKKNNDAIVLVISNDLDTVFGQNIKDLKPKKKGNTYSFLYFNNNPIIIIGPGCKFKLFNFLIF